MTRARIVRGIAAVALGLTLCVGAGSRTVHAQPTEQIELFKGCNNVATTFPTGTPASMVAAAITPQSNLLAVWFFINAQQKFIGFSPIPGAPNDLMTVDRAAPLFICMTGPGTFTRPMI